MVQKSNLEFLTETGLRDAELIAILGNGATGNLVTLLDHAFNKFIVCQRLALVLVINTFLKSLLEFAGGYFLPLLILKSL
jgi:hypothetical protein